MIRIINESISWEQSIESNAVHNYVKDYGKFTIGKQSFLVSYVLKDVNHPEFTNSWQITSIHPYDDAEHHWARAYDGDNAYKIYYKGKFVESYPVSDVGSEDSILSVAERLLELDVDINPRMVYD